MIIPLRPHRRQFPYGRSESRYSAGRCAGCEAPISDPARWLCDRCRMSRERELRHFLLLDRAQQAQAIKRLAFSGMRESTIAAATGLSVEAVRRILAKTPAVAAGGAE